MQNKINKKFKPSSCIYKLGRVNYLKQPKNTYIAYYVKDESGYTAILRKHILILPVIAVLFILLFLYFKINYINTNVIKFTGNVEYYNNELYVSIVNNTDHDVSISLELGKDVLYAGNVSPGNSLTNVSCNKSLDKGNYSAILTATYKGIKKTRNVLISVR